MPTVFIYETEGGGWTERWTNIQPLNMAVLKIQGSRIFYKKVKFIAHHNGYLLEYSVFVTGGSCIFTILAVLFYPTQKRWVLIFVVCCQIPVSVECLVAGISAINIINSTCLMNVYSLMSFVFNNLLWCICWNFTEGSVGIHAVFPVWSSVTYLHEDKWTRAIKLHHSQM